MLFFTNENKKLKRLSQQLTECFSRKGHLFSRSIECERLNLFHLRTTFGDIFVSNSAVLLNHIQSKMALSTYLTLSLIFVWLEYIIEKQQMASPTSNNTNNTFKTKVPGSIHQSDRFLECVQYFISLLFV